MRLVLLCALALLAALAAAAPDVDNPSCPSTVPFMCDQCTLGNVWDAKKQFIDTMANAAQQNPDPNSKPVKQLAQYGYTNLNALESCGVLQYTTGLYKLWNGMLRGTALPTLTTTEKNSATPAGETRAFDDASESPQIECAVVALRKMPGYTKMAHRYMNDIPLNLIGLGRVYQDQAFFSATSRPATNALQALATGGGFKHQLLIFPPDDGTSRGHKVKLWSQFTEESEILFEPKTRFCDFFHLDHKHLFDTASTGGTGRDMTACRNCKLYMMLEMKDGETEDDCKNLAGIFWHEALDFHPDDEQDHAHLKMPAANVQATARAMLLRALAYLGRADKFIPEVQMRDDPANQAAPLIALQAGGNRRKLQRAKNVAFTIGPKAPNYIPAPPPLTADAQAVADVVADEKSTWKKIGSGIGKLVNKVLKK